MFLALLRERKVIMLNLSHPFDRSVVFLPFNLHLFSFSIPFTYSLLLFLFKPRYLLSFCLFHVRSLEPVLHSCTYSLSTSPISSPRSSCPLKQKDRLIVLIKEGKLYKNFSQWFLLLDLVTCV